MKDVIAGVETEKFVGLKPKKYLLLVDRNYEHKKAKDVNKNVVEKLTPNEYKDVLLNDKCVRLSINNNSK